MRTCTRASNIPAASWFGRATYSPGQLALVYIPPATVAIGAGAGAGVSGGGASVAGGGSIGLGGGTSCDPGLGGGCAAANVAPSERKATRLSPNLRIKSSVWFRRGSMKQK